MATDAGLTADAPIKARRKRRWFQFSLRTLMVLMLAFACGFGWLAYWIKQARQQRQTVETLLTKGGGIGVRAESGPWVVLLGKLLGEDLLLDGHLVLRAEAVYLDTAPVTDSDMEHVRVLANVEKLSLKGTQVTDAGLVHLRGLKQLAELKLDNTPITDAGLVHLRGLTNLTLLSLRGTKVTDTGVAELQKALPNVQIQR